MIIYLSGPMTSAHRQDDVFPAFESAAARLRQLGHFVISPVETFAGADAGWDICMKQDVHSLLTVDAVVVLPDWHLPEMVGVRVELVLAATLGVPVHEFADAWGLGPRLWSGLSNRGTASRLLVNPDPR